MSDLLRTRKSPNCFVLRRFVCAHVFTNTLRRQNALILALETTSGFSRRSSRNIRARDEASIVELREP